jgi:para-aminobenzoate synthetase/4-amino-4-deoxychorismate lyase
LTFRSRFVAVGDPLALYLSLRERSLASCGGYVDDGRRQVLSLSPELFFEITKDGRITARPMKGTAPRGQDVSSDDRAREALASSDKDRAENLMIVDLIRNDLGRIAEMGSVEVRELFAVERYPTLHQLVSTVSAQLRRHVGIEQIVKALFPCGSVTGAPKIRAMEVIHALEASPRGIYCGAIGHFAPDGSARFNVAIRTLTIEDEVGELGIGGGVVHDSMAAGEYAECLLKSEYFSRARKPLGLIETLGFAPDAGFARRDLHLARLERSARRFGIPFDPSAVRRSLEAAVSRRLTNARVRLELDENGSLRAAAEEMAQGVQGAWRFAISPSHVSSFDALAAHKTDWRNLYDEERARVQETLGCDEVVFVNERGELVEGSRTNLFLQRGDKLLTPPLSSGCLDGCLRRDLLEQGKAVETTLYEHDLGIGSLYLGNSLRGLISAELAGVARTLAQQGRR